MNNLNKSIMAVIERCAIESYPNEACGVITKIGRKLVAAQCENISDTPEDLFVISSDQYRSFLDTTGVYGIWHTHIENTSEASPTDVAACNATGVDWFILDIYKTEDGFRFGELFHQSPENCEDDYLERMYIYGVRDCFTLAVDYYRREFSININHRAKGYPEISNWVESDENLLIDNYLQAGFVDVTGQPHEIGDLLLIQMSKKTDHVAIYVGDDRILHHCVGRLSTTDVYGGGYWQKHTTHHLRWKGFVSEGIA